MSRIKISILLLASTFLFIFANTPDYLSSPIIEQSKYINPEPRPNSNFPPSQPIPFSIFWDTLAPIPDTLYRAAGCCDTSGNFYWIGGQDGTNVIQNTVYKYFANEDTWCEVQPMLYALSNLGAVFHAPTNRIYVFGGYTGSSSVNYTQIYDIAQDSWFLGTPHYLNYLGSYGATIGDTIYVTGSDLSALSIGIWGYNVNTNEWRFISSLPGGSANGSATAYENKIYFAGGWEDKDTVCEYTTGIGITDSLFCYLPRGSYGHCFEEVQGKLWLFGLSASWPNPWYTVYSYDLDQGPNGIWSNENPLPYQIVSPYGKMFFRDSWRLHAIGSPHLRGTITSQSIIDIALLRINQPRLPNPNPYPNVTLKNVGTVSVPNIPVTMWIDSQSTRIYSQSRTTFVPLNPGDTVNVSFPLCVIGVPGVSYVLTAFTSVAGDSNQTNDSLRLIIYEKGLIWTDLPINQAASLMHGSCGDTMGNFYVYGGFNNGHYDSSLFRYDVISRTWTQLTDMLVGVSNITGTYDLARNRIYVPGGYSPYRDFLQVYYVDEDTWGMGAPMPMANSGPPCAVIGDSLYVVSSSPTAGVLMIYNINTNSWSFGQTRPSCSTYSKLVAYNGELYSSGGYPEDNSFYKYTPATDNWIRLPDLPEGRYAHGMVVIDNRIVVVGGLRGWSGVDTICYMIDMSLPVLEWKTENPPSDSAVGILCSSVTTNGETQIHVVGRIHQAGAYQMTAINEINPTHITKSSFHIIPTLAKHSVQIRVVNSGIDIGNILVFDNCGRLIRKFSPILGKGEFTIIWDKTDDKGINVTPGVYFIIFDKRGEKMTEKVIIID